MKRRYFRGDAAFAIPEIDESLEADDYKFTIRLPANSILQENIAWPLKRPVGRPPQGVRRYASFSYQAGSWSKPRRWWRRWSGIPVNSIRASGSS